ncbi:hypothetical protein DNTS_023991 [Danionella cerebrum]|uniref:RNA-binding motif protein, X-linked 2 n=1 Tax=Danionella cerebrum TaxID=2873325 RepID=A0A553MVB5_9TELE|nr:hypothetical protein DNTS_023991 [Danionella translucida]
MIIFNTTQDMTLQSLKENFRETSFSPEVTTPAMKQTVVLTTGIAITGIATDALQGTTASMEKGICMFRMTFIIAPTGASILSMFLISLERYMAIKLPLRYCQIMNEKVIAGTLVGSWLISMIVGFSPSIFKTLQKDDYNKVCTFFSVIEPKIIVVVFCLFFFPLLSVFIYFYMDILKIACGHQKRIQAQQAGIGLLTSSRYWGHVKALRTVAVLVGCFTIFWCPFFVASIVQISCPDCELYYFLENHLWLLGTSNSLINPLVYACWQQEVRSQLCEMFVTIKVGLCHGICTKAGDGFPMDNLAQSAKALDKIKEIPLTKVKLINELNDREAQLGVKETVSWHSVYKDSAWVFIGGFPYELSEGDIICVFSQYGEIANINLVRDKKTGKSKGFCFLCYEDQRSTILAVDNFNGIKIKGRTIRVDHVANYRPPKDTDDIDDITKRLREEGCAPKAVSSSEEELEVPVKKHKKDKKEKKKKKKEKKEKRRALKEERSSETSSSPVQVKKEKEDAAYEKYTVKGPTAYRRDRADDRERYAGERDRQREEGKKTDSYREDKRYEERERDRGTETHGERERQRERNREREHDRDGERQRERERDGEREKRNDKHRNEREHRRN